jgi:DNA polymerase-4
MLNKNKPVIMHIDLNCCFAIIEQQANRLLRGRPVAVSAYSTDRGMVLASSYEAKSKGVKLGVNNREARALAPGIVILTPDPAKYREANKRFHELLLEFTPSVTPKSIDEFVLDFAGSRLVPDSLTHDQHCQRMREIGKDIKDRVKERLGEWVTVNVGIGTNRFLAKYGAGFGKPDGMTLIDYRNVEALYTWDPHKHKPMELIDLPGINIRYAARLRACGIHSPLEFYHADQELLKKVVFKSVVGYYWWARLRGHEVDNRTFNTKSIGHQYAVSKKTTDRKEIERLFMKLCEKVGRRLRKKNFCARGIHVYLGFEAYKDTVDLPYAAYTDTRRTDVGTTGFDNVHRLRSWHEGHRLEHRLYAGADIFHATRTILNKAEIHSRVKLIAITVYDLEPWDPEQMSIFDIPIDDKSAPHHYRSQEATKRLSDAMDTVNNRYGEFVLTPATMMDMKGEILDRIAFANAPQLD